MFMRHFSGSPDKVVNYRSESIFPSLNDLCRFIHGHLLYGIDF